MSRHLYKSYLVIFLFCSFVSSDEYSVMTLNVENLFDTKDDLKKNDKAFLPIEQKQSKKHKESCSKIRVNSWKNECLYLDWNIETKDAKLKNLVDYILLFENGADIIALQEVENNNILNQLYKLLEPYGYIDFVLLVFTFIDFFVLSYRILAVEIGLKKAGTVFIGSSSECHRA